MPTDTLEVLVEDVTTDPWSDFFEGPTLETIPTCTCCSQACGFALPDDGGN